MGDEKIIKLCSLLSWSFFYLHDIAKMYNKFAEALDKYEDFSYDFKGGCEQQHMSIRTLSNPSEITALASFSE